MIRLKKLIPISLLAITLMALVAIGCKKSSGPSEVAVTSITLSTSTLEMSVGDTEILTAKVLPSNASDASITWATSNSSVAKVKDGVVAALKAGTATITASAGAKSATCKVTVSDNGGGTTEVEVSSITLSSSTLAIKVGESSTLTATVKPDNATNKTITWSSSDKTVATVEDGVVAGIKEGTATITASAGSKSATCKVTVSKNVVAVTSITLNKSSLTLTEGDSETLTATVSPSDATDPTVTWTSSNTSVATVSNGTVTAIKEGSATITAKAGEKTATCKVTVEKKYVAVSDISLNFSSLDLTEGDTQQITVTITPSDATDQTVTYSSSDNSVVTVSEDGTVTAVGPGTATITVTVGGVSKTITVTVVAKTIAVTSISLDNTSLSIKVGDTQQITATVQPDDATDKSVTWTSSDASVATVDNNGTVTGVSVGTATITAQAGDYTATCTVTVNKIEVTSITLSETKVDLKVGGSTTITATVSPDNATYKTVTWSSSDSSIASVDNGTITALKIGSTTITATADGQSATCTVNVVMSGSSHEGTDVEPWN